MRRRELLKTAAKFMALALAGGVLWRVNAKAKNITLLRPPGARSEAEFASSCIRCGLCVLACPFDTLYLADVGEGAGAGTPVFIPRSEPCHMCRDIPCALACPTGALDLNLLKDESGKISINRSKMGVAVVDSEHCLAYWGIRCDACYRVCPLIDRAIKIDYRRNERTKAHAYLLPVVDMAVCTGCGMCERACITEQPSIRILPNELVKGSVSKSYIKGWDKSDEQRIDNKNGGKIAPNSSQSAQDYLNSGDEL